MGDASVGGWVDGLVGYWSDSIVQTVMLASFLLLLPYFLLLLVMYRLLTQGLYNQGIDTRLLDRRGLAEAYFDCCGCICCSYSKHRYYASQAGGCVGVKALWSSQLQG
jgi:hypothetical protein